MPSTSSNLPKTDLRLVLVSEPRPVGDLFWKLAQNSFDMVTLLAGCLVLGMGYRQSLESVSDAKNAGNFALRQKITLKHARENRAKRRSPNTTDSCSAMKQSGLS